jgi:hypothetical protein
MQRPESLKSEVLKEGATMRGLPFLLYLSIVAAPAFAQPPAGAAPAAPPPRSPEDGLIAANRQLREWLTSKGVRHTDIETPGAHMWLVWRRNLVAFAPLLFQDASTSSSKR